MYTAVQKLKNVLKEIKQLSKGTLNCSKATVKKSYCYKRFLFQINLKRISIWHWKLE